MTKKSIKELVKKLEACQVQLGIDRDALRSVRDEADGLIECCSRAREDLESAIESLSELV